MSLFYDDPEDPFGSTNGSTDLSLEDKLIAEYDESLSLYKEAQAQERDAWIRVKETDAQRKKAHTRYTEARSRALEARSRALEARDRYIDSKAQYDEAWVIWERVSLSSKYDQATACLKDAAERGRAAQKQRDQAFAYFFEAIRYLKKSLVRLNDTRERVKRAIAEYDNF